MKSRLPRFRLALPLMFLACFAAVASAQAQPQPTPQPDAALTAKIQALIAPFHGDVSFYAQDLATGRTVAVNADQPVPTASVIKLAILYDALQQIRAGRLHFDDRITVTHQDQVPGSGVLLFFDTPLNITFKDALTLMIALSDNTAANLSMEHVGIKNVDDELIALGLKNTWLYKKVFTPPTGPMPPDQKQFGLGKTTAREMAELMDRFAACNLGPAPTPAAAAAPSDKDLCAAALHMLSVQFYRDGIPRYLEGDNPPPGITGIYNKTGSINHARNDVGAIVTKHGTIVISIFTNHNADTSWTADNDAEVLMAHLARTVIDNWDTAP